MEQLRINLLGGLSAYREGRPLATQITQKPQSLFAYLATYRYRVHRRDQLAGLFWGESDEKRARSSLRTTLYELRAALDAPWRTELPDR